MKKVDYESSGVSIDNANKVKKKFEEIVSVDKFTHCKPINQVGAFASLVELDLKSFSNPVFVLKSEEPGSKQLLSISNDKIEWIARDLINHLVNDIIVMGAVPCAVLDTIICGKFQPDTVLRLVKEISKACSENGCILVGGETSEQPGVLPAGRYILQASVLGIVDKDKIVDGKKIKNGDVLIALASNGLHTNGYSLVRKLMDNTPEILDEAVDGESFLDSVLKPHFSYFTALNKLFKSCYESIHGMAHITGGGLHDNLIRILHNDGLSADIDLSKIKIPAVFKTLRQYSGMSDGEMLQTFNNGVGLVLAADKDAAETVIKNLTDSGVDSYIIGEVVKSAQKGVTFKGKLNWSKS